MADIEEVLELSGRIEFVKYAFKQNWILQLKPRSEKCLGIHIYLLVFKNNKKRVLREVTMLEGLAIFLENLYNQDGCFVGVHNFVKFFHMKGCSPIFLLTSIFVTIPIAVFLIWDKKAPACGIIDLLYM